MEKIRKIDIDIENKLYVPFLLGILKERKTFKVCETCYKDKTTHTCCIGCKLLNKDFTCKNRNINCTLWFCDRIIRKLKSMDLLNFSMVAKEMIDKDWNRYRLSLKTIKGQKYAYKRKTYYGSLGNILIHSFTGRKKLYVWIRIKIHNIRMWVKTMLNGKIHGCN